jgi:hypothetical protein
MKSAYELAMERLERESGPGKKLSDEQRAEIAEIDKIFDAKVAESKLESEAKLATATTPDELTTLQVELNQQLADYEAEREAKKNAVWGE